MDSYYSTLIIDSNTVENLSSTTTNFSQEISLNGNWQVGLKSISFPRSWKTLPHRDNVGLVIFGEGERSYINVISSSYGDIFAGNYTEQEFINNINLAIDRYIIPGIDGKNYLRDYPGRCVVKKPEIRLENKRVYIQLGILDNRELIYVKFSDHYCDILGFSNHVLQDYYRDTFARYHLLKQTKPYLEIIDSDTNIWSNRNIEMNSIKCFHVTADIVEDSVFGSLKKPLLRTVFIPSKQKGDVFIDFENPDYISVRDNNFRSIKIDIFKELNHTQTSLRIENLLDFKYGRITLKLHFRRVKVNIDRLDVEQVNTNTEIAKPTVEPHPLSNLPAKTVGSLLEPMKDLDLIL